MEWFSRMFRDTQKTVDFIALFRQKASYSPHKGFIWPFDTEEEDEDKDASEFSVRLKDVYKYEVLGGHHMSAARSELHKENPDNPLFSHILAEIYVGLTDDEALRLASRHNDNGHFVHKMTHWDYVRDCIKAPINT